MKRQRKRVVLTQIAIDDSNTQLETNAGTPNAAEHDGFIRVHERQMRPVWMTEHFRERSVFFSFFQKLM